jgi:phage terminase Nu1 subunit (DNA packaging protein)
VELNGEQLAEAFGVARSAVTAWVRRGCPHQKRGRQYVFVLRDVLAWKEEQRRLAAEDLELTQERARLARAQTEKTELEVRRLKGELIPRQEVERAWGNMIAAFRARMVAIPTKLAPRVSGATPVEAKALLEEAIHEALAELAAGRAPAEPAGGGSEGPEAGGAATKAHRQRVGRPRKTAQQRKRGRARAVAN